MNEENNGLAELPPVVEWGKTSLAIRPNLEFWEWAKLGRVLRDLNGSIQWWLGSWYLYGEDHYGEQAADAIEPYAAQTLHNCTWVSSRFPPSRRRELLSFGHHAEVAAMPELVADELLDAAEAGNWSRGRLREEAKRKRLGEPQPDVADVYDAPYVCPIKRCQAEHERLERALAERAVCKHCGATWD